jgi:hypothetical protein
MDARQWAGGVDEGKPGGRGMKLYIVTAVCSALMLIVFMVGNLDAQMPYYDLGAFRASEGWKWTQMLGANLALPFLAFVSLFASIIGMVVRHLTVNQPTNQPTKLGNQHNQPAQLSNQRAQLAQPTDQLDITVEVSDAPYAIPLREPPEPGELSHAIKRAVLVTGDCKGDMAAAAEKLGIGYEGVRKSVALARREYPEWVNWHIPPKR